MSHGFEFNRVNDNTLVVETPIPVTNFLAAALAKSTFPDFAYHNPDPEWSDGTRHYWHGKRGTFVVREEGRTAITDGEHGWFLTHCWLPDDGKTSVAVCRWFSMYFPDWGTGYAPMVMESMPTEDNAASLRDSAAIYREAVQELFESSERHFRDENSVEQALSKISYSLGHNWYYPGKNYVNPATWSFNASLHPEMRGTNMRSFANAQFVADFDVAHQHNLGASRYEQQCQELLAQMKGRYEQLLAVA